VLVIEATQLSREKDVAEQERNLKVRWQALFDKEAEVKRKDEENKVLESALESWQEKLSERESKLSIRTNYHGSDLTSSGAMHFDH
jgi:predicted RNase H-like nuclease (RuvC/YqgF family)